MPTVASIVSRVAAFEVTADTATFVGFVVPTSRAQKGMEYTTLALAINALDIDARNHEGRADGVIPGTVISRAAFDQAKKHHFAAARGTAVSKYRTGLNVRAAAERKLMKAFQQVLDSVR